MSNPNSEIAHTLVKTLLGASHRYYHGVSRAQYDEVYARCHKELIQILNWGSDPLKLKPILANMNSVEGNLWKRGKAMSWLWCKCANHIGYLGECWVPWD